MNWPVRSEFGNFRVICFNGVSLPLDYSILEKIGEGSFSEVFRVKHKRTGFYYAAKKLTKLYFDPAEALQDSEIRVMKLLDYHPNVLSFVDILQ